MRLNDGNGSPAKFSLPTVGPRGIKFRSRMESRWAQWFEDHNVIWEYEAEGFTFMGVRYLPDFWLPEIKTFIEVKGILDPVDEIKLQLLAEHMTPKGIATAVVHDVRPAAQVVLVTPTLTYYIPADCEEYQPPPLEDIAAGKYQMTVAEAQWGECVDCGRWYVVEVAGSWNCSYCDRNNGHDLVPGWKHGFPQWAKDWTA